MPPKKNSKTKNSNGATLDFESPLWAAADKLRGHIDASEYKHVVLGLIFLKYISDSFEEAHAQSGPNTFKLAKMNLTIRGIEGNLGKELAASFHKDLHRWVR